MELKQSWASFSSMDGELLVPVQHIDYVLWHPGKDTSKLYLKNGRVFEVSGTRHEVEKKIKNSGYDMSWMQKVSGDAYGI